jgi:hypothetical protein
MTAPDFKKCFGTPNGERVLRAILDHCGHGTELWAREESAALRNLYRHDVGTWILNKTKEKANEGSEQDND